MFLYKRSFVAPKIRDKILNEIATDYKYTKELHKHNHNTNMLFLIIYGAICYFIGYKSNLLLN
jgi:hypothetical protein